MNLLRTFALGCVAVFGVACTSQQNTETAHPTGSLGAPVEREGIIYTPVSVGSQGCLLYHIKIPGGQAPAALAYQSTALALELAGTRQEQAGAPPVHGVRLDLNFRF